jgi:hypothetical protein
MTVIWAGQGVDEISVVLNVSRQISRCCALMCPGSPGES